MTATELDPRLPCIVGTARRTWHPGDGPAPEPLAMWAEVARSAAADARSTRDPLPSIDYLGVVHCQSWAYDHPADHLAASLGLGPGERQVSVLAGTAPQRLIDDAAVRMLRGEISAAIVVGAEAFATEKQFRKAGETPPWSHPHPSPPQFPVDLDEWYLPTEMAHGVLPAWLTFALLGQARWAERGATAADRQAFADLMGQLNAVAGANPDAWFRQPYRPAELTTATADNRMVAFPYTKRTTAFMDVDMAAANLLVTKGVADDWGIPDEHRVYLRGWGFARDEIHIAARAELGSSPAMRRATSSALAAAGLQVDDVDVFDLYSCFGSAVQFAQDALGLDALDPRPITVTGGLPYHGGPSSNYLSHSTSHLVDHLRSHPDQIALATGIGMHMTKHVAAVWANRPGPLLRAHDDGDQHWNAPESAEARAVLDHHDGEARMVAASVVHAPDGTPDHAIAVCEVDDGARCYATSRDADVIAAISEDRWPEMTATISAGPTVNELHIGPKDLDSSRAS